MILEYLSQKKERLGKRYRADNPRFRESCSIIAGEVAHLLLKDGKHPYLMRINGPIIDSMGNRKSITFNQLDKDVKSGAHIVCCEGEYVYDPIIGMPMALDKYLQTAFRENVDSEIVITSENILEFLSR